MHRPSHSPAPATGHAVIAAALCVSLLVMLPLAAVPAIQGLVSLVLALFGN